MDLAFFFVWTNGHSVGRQGRLAVFLLLKRTWKLAGWVRSQLTSRSVQELSQWMFFGWALSDESSVATAGPFSFIALVRFIAGVFMFDPLLVLVFSVGGLGPPQQSCPLHQQLDKKIWGSEKVLNIWKKSDTRSVDRKFLKSSDFRKFSEIQNSSEAQNLSQNFSELQIFGQTIFRYPDFLSSCWCGWNHGHAKMTCRWADCWRCGHRGGITFQALPSSSPTMSQQSVFVRVFPEFVRAFPEAPWTLLLFNHAPFILGPIPMFFNHMTLVLACPNQHWHWPTPLVHFHTVQPDLPFCCSTIQHMYWPVLPMHLFIVAWPIYMLSNATTLALT